MMMLERASKNNSGDTATNEHLGNCARMCLTDILVAGSQHDMETQACKYGSSISLFIKTITLKMGMVSTCECN